MLEVEEKLKELRDTASPTRPEGEGYWERYRKRIVAWGCVWLAFFFSCARVSGSVTWP